MSIANLDRIQPTLKSGDEHFSLNGKKLEHSLLDFWRWSVSDILSNATRGRFAEFIVATATNIDISNCRDEWGSYDLQTPEGITIEVKSAAYLQSWFQNSLSKVSFGIKETRSWNPETNKSSDSIKRQADIYVFCLLKHKDKQTVDPLNLDQWEFYVLSTRQLSDAVGNRKSISLKLLRTLRGAVSYDCIASELRKNFIQI